MRRDFDGTRISVGILGIVCTFEGDFDLVVSEIVVVDSVLYEAVGGCAERSEGCHAHREAATEE
mgnify:CR=1 FL=1